MSGRWEVTAGSKPANPPGPAELSEQLRFQGATVPLFKH